MCNQPVIGRDISASRLREHVLKFAEDNRLLWESGENLPCGLAWLDGTARDGEPGRVAVAELFREQAFPLEAVHEIVWRRDAMGKPFIEWHGQMAAWAAERSIVSQHVQVSNTHDGDAHLAIAFYGPHIIGAGIDVVHLPRLTKPGKNADYLHRFAAKFMSEKERNLFLTAAVNDTEESLRLRVAAHFSLMEAASKACGTGLKIGAGMGKPTSLPKRSLGVAQLEPEIALLFENEAVAHLENLSAKQYEAYYAANESYLVSVVILKNR